MQGYVLWYRPASARGLVVSDDGIEIPFVASDAADRFAGGDLVAFDFVRAAGKPAAERIRILERGVNRVGVVAATTVAELFHTLQMDACA